MMFMQIVNEIYVCKVSCFIVYTELCLPYTIGLVLEGIFGSVLLQEMGKHKRVVRACAKT